MMDPTPQTISSFLSVTVAGRGDEPALGFIRNGELHWRTWLDVAEEAGRLAAQFQSAGVAPGDRIAQVSENRYEWVITDLAIHLARAVHVPIHVTLSGQQIAEQIADCDARLVFVSTHELLAKFSKLLNDDTQTSIYDQSPIAATQLVAGALGPAACPQPPAPHDLATILYTSGTTGRPRGVMLSQQNLATNAATTAEAHGGGPEQTRLCVLPLSHIYARTCDLYTWIYRGCRLVLAESRDTLARDCQLVRPTALNAVPYLYQRIAEKIAADCNNSPPSQGGARGRFEDARPLTQPLQGERSKSEAAALCQFFGGHMERLSSGGAALAANVEAWFAAQGLPILQGYGLSEASPVISVSTFSANRFGSVGQPLPGLEVRVADDGEILVRGPNVMLGYWHDEAATAEAIRDGWLHTGDLGELDADNFLFIRGRKKELIVLSTGKKVLPTRVESLLTASPLIQQAAVFGDGQCGLVALIVPAVIREQRASSEVYAAEIKRCLKSAAHEEQVWHFTLLDRPFSMERGELTPKLSLCRKVIAQNFAAELKAI